MKFVHGMLPIVDHRSSGAMSKALARTETDPTKSCEDCNSVTGLRGAEKLVPSPSWPTAASELSYAECS